MKTSKKTTRTGLDAILLGLCLLVSPFSFAAGLLTPTNANLPELQIKDHEVDVIIEDGYAITQVDQVFHNPHGQDLEARYSFPVPAHASVGELTMWIDGKPVTGEVLEKKQARTIYEQEKQAGRDSALTEKDGYKTFEVMVTPVRAGKDTRIRLVYLQPAHIDTGIGRYVYPLEEGGVDEDKLAFWTANKKVTNKFRFNLTVKSAYPVDALRVPNHSQAKISQGSNGEWSVRVGHQTTNNSNATASKNSADNGQAANTSTAVNTSHPLEGGSAATAPAFNPQQGQHAYTLDKDMVVYWRLKPGLPGSVDLITYKPDASKRGTFMMVVTPGDDLKPITKGSDYVFVLDISGSMQGKYSTLADGVQRAMKKMNPNDRFRIVLFNNKASELTSGYVNATADQVKHYAQKIAAITPNNGTNLYEGLASGLKSIDADRTSAIVLVTDGVANVGETHQRKFIDLIRKKDVRLFTFIMGNSANRPMLEVLTRESGGFAISMSNSDDIVGQILKATSKITHQALHGVEIDIKGIKTANITPQKIGSLYRGQQLVVFGHYWGDGVANVSIKGKISGARKNYSTSFSFPASSVDNPEIERLWAYASIEDMMEKINDFGEKADIKNGIISLGVEYGLVTDYTSMLVVRDEVFTSHKIDRSNKRRLAVEQAAQQQRKAKPAANRRVDTNKPTFSLPRPNFGGGAIDPWTLLLFALLAVGVISRTRKGGERAA